MTPYKTARAFLDVFRAIGWIVLGISAFGAIMTLRDGGLAAVLSAAPLAITGMTVIAGSYVATAILDIADHVSRIRMLIEADRDR